MIKFFRRIRQQLLSENKFSKYLFYAVGEILLVVIGILIALSINNWNENKKLLKEEVKLLKAMEREIASNLSNLDSAIIKGEATFEASSKFLKNALNNPEFEYRIDDLNTILGYNINGLDTSIINEVLGTNSRSLISDDAILEQIRALKKMYEKADKTEFYVDTFWNDQVTQYYNTSGLGVYWSSVEINEKDLVRVSLDQTFFSLLGIMNSYQNSLLLSRYELRQELKTTLKLLEEN